MNKLQLCQALRREASGSGTGPITTVGQAGEYGEFVAWIENAYIDIQNLYASWRFRQADFSFTLTADKSTYTPAEALITDLLKWKTDDVRIYLSAADEQEIAYMPWDSFRRACLIGTINSSRPSIFSVKPNNSIVFYQTPNDAYTAVGEYVKTVDELSGDTDTPVFPSDYHMIIVWRALVMNAGLVAAPERYAHGSHEYTRLMRAMTATELPEMAWGNPLA